MRSHRPGDRSSRTQITTICEALLGAFHPREAEIWMRVLSGMWDGPKVRFLADRRLVEDGAHHDLPVIGTKLFADGSVTGRTAALSNRSKEEQIRGC